MATVIAARLQLQDEVEETIDALEHAGFARTNIASFYVNPPGQHATYPIGGDRYDSPGIKEAGSGAAKGATVAAVAGAVIGAGLSPAGAALGGLVGAHAGSLIGSLSHAKEKGEAEDPDAGAVSPQTDADDNSNTVPLRKAGMLIAVGITDRRAEDEAVQEAVRVLRRCGAVNVEQAEGDIVGSEWRDFDPLSTPHYL